MIIDSPICHSCKYYKEDILYKYSCDKYETVPKEIINWTKKCKYFKEEK